MKYYADLHIHSLYSRATSKDMNLDGIVKHAKLKGLHMIGTGDFTHPLWFAHLERNLEPKGDGVYHYKGIDFMLTTEVSNIYSENGRVRKVHSLIILPDFKLVKEFSKELRKYGKLESDGRPTFGMSLKTLAKILFSIYPDAILIPAHAWTPWFSVFGSNSGFDSLEEAFGEYTEKIYAIETGLSSDPPMNWMLSSLDRVVLISNSDAHSPQNLGREANCFSEPITYSSLLDILKNRDRKRFLYTIEFFPEEGKYHYDGHRKCGVRLDPEESMKMKGLCPVCGKPLTIGVLHRVYQLADRKRGTVPEGAIPYKSLVPLREIMAEALGMGKGTSAVDKAYMKAISYFGDEFTILLDVPIDELKRGMDPRVVEGIRRVREGKLRIIPGYDGVYGTIRIFGDDEEEKKKEKRQLSLF
ncbi:DNA helicase UvrD [bacterium]|nr:MAG: DNA helicase UvrD [bacterium]